MVLRNKWNELFPSQVKVSWLLQQNFILNLFQLQFQCQNFLNCKCGWFILTDLILSSVEFIAILEQELVSRLETGCSAVFDDRAGSRRRAELLHLKKENVRRTWIHGEAGEERKIKIVYYRTDENSRQVSQMQRLKLVLDIYFYLLKKKWTIE